MKNAMVPTHNMTRQNRIGFWLIALLCVLFYSAVFPFIKYAADLMVQKYNVDPKLAGTIPGLLPIGAIILTPLFGSLYDRIGKGATLMVIGSVMLIFVHTMFALPILNIWWFATVIMIILGFAFSLVPSAMWPSVPKIIPEKQLGTAYALIFWVQNWGLMGVSKLIDLGIVFTRLAVSNCVANREAQQFATVVSVEPIEGRHDSFCFTEPTNHTIH
jgi:predicted MFS family arabinose efflux permease